MGAEELEDGVKPRSSESVLKAKKKKVMERQEELMGRIEKAETRLGEIDAAFCEPTYFERTPAGKVKALEDERAAWRRKVAKLMAEWESTEDELEGLG